jgi:3-isopropylmalate/(R)-2-methylmalate dehydratase small subunit
MIKPFEIITGTAAVLPIDNIDTDMIFPKQFLHTTKRTGLGENVFFELRYDKSGEKNVNFVLNIKPFDTARILIVGKNFGCGSSREHAPWALLDFGIKCIIAPSFADIFYSNCFKNELLPIVLTAREIAKLSGDAKDGGFLTIDLPTQSIISNNNNISFQIDLFHKNCLLEGLDEIGMTLKQETAIYTFEKKQSLSKPWL